MTEGRNRQRNSDWTWAAIIVGALLVVTIICLFSALLGGMIGFTLARATVRAIPEQRAPFGPFEMPEPMPRFEPRPPGQGERAWLGVTYFTTSSGAEISSVTVDSPADEAGLRTGDVITAVNGRPVTPERSLAAHIQRYEPGDLVELTVMRGDRERTISVRFGATE